MAAAAGNGAGDPPLRFDHSARLVRVGRLVRGWATEERAFSEIQRRPGPPRPILSATRNSLLRVSCSTNWAMQAHR